MTVMRSILGLGLIGTLLICGCGLGKPKYGVEKPLSLAGTKQQVWAVAPVVNLSGQRQVDPILQADLLFQQLQQVNGLTVVPVNRVAEVYSSLRLEKIQSEEQAALVCDLLGCDALVVGSVTAYDPYNPPKLGIAIQVFRKPGGYTRSTNVDARELARRATLPPGESLPQGRGFVQVVGMYDAANGSVRDALVEFGHGRNDPQGPFGPEEYLVNMDRFSGFVYYQLIAELLKEQIQTSNEPIK